MHSVYLVTLLAAFMPTCASAQSLPSLPQEMLGVWGYELEDCTDERSDLRLIIEPMRVDFYAAAYQLRRIGRTYDGGIYATAWRNDEGSRRRYSDVIQLRILPDGKLHVRGATNHSYSRCKEHKQ